MPHTDDDQGRRPLSRARVLGSAVALADEQGLDAVSMRRLAQGLGVDPMSLYKHVANKDDLLAGMVDLVVGEAEAEVAGGDGDRPHAHGTGAGGPDGAGRPVDEGGGGGGGGGGWKAALRGRALAARRAMLRHTWARVALERSAGASPAVMAHYDAVAGILRGGGFSPDLTHHALHVLGSRLLGFSQELFDDSAALAEGPEVLALNAHRMAGQFPHLAEMMLVISHDEATVVGSGCDDQFEFTFALDLILDGLERARDAAARPS